MTTDPLTLLFLALHILAAGIWISQFVAEIALERFAQTVKGKPGEVALRMAEGRIASLLGSIGGMGILISGLILTGAFHYGLLGIGGVYTPPWLVIKQVFYLIAMALVGAIITPGSRRMMPLLGQALAASQPIPPQAQAAFDRIQLVSRLINLLVLINIFLAVFGVNGGFMV